jgi:hypothetical protein
MKTGQEASAFVAPKFEKEPPPPKPKTPEPEEEVPEVVNVLDPNMLQNLDKEEVKTKVLTPPPTPPRAKTPSVETEIAESEIIEPVKEEEINTFYNEPLPVKVEIYNLTNKDYIEQRHESLKGMLKMDKSSAGKSHIIILPPQDEPFNTYYMEISDDEYTRTYYRTSFDFANTLIESYMVYSPDPLIEPIKS